MPKMRPEPVDPNEVTRYTLKMSNGHQHKLAQIAKEFKISQTEVLEAMIDHIDMEKMGPIFTQIRTNKVAEREEKKELVKKLAKLDASQLRELEKLAELGGAG